LSTIAALTQNTQKYNKTVMDTVTVVKDLSDKKLRYSILYKSQFSRK